MLRTIPMLAALTLAACSTTPVRTVQLPDGTSGLVVDCSGTRNDQTVCMNRAAVACDGPYAIVAQNESNVGAIALSPTLAGNAIRRSMVVKCQ